MHKNLPKYYYFIDDFNKEHIKNLNKNIAIIYRSYEKTLNLNEIINIKISIKLDLDGVYLPSFNKSLKINNYAKKNNFIVIGSAHNLYDVNIKIMQGVEAIFIASLFNKKKSYLGFEKFKILRNLIRKKVIALGGINKRNLKKLNMLDVYGFAAISYFDRTKKNGP